jgi:hypothetical protein
MAKEWNDMTKDALEKIKIAEGNLLSIKERQPGWEANRDKLTADQKQKSRQRTNRPKPVSKRLRKRSTQPRSNWSSE